MFSFEPKYQIFDLYMSRSITADVYINLVCLDVDDSLVTES